MTISTVKGHLTALDKKAFKAIIGANASEARTKRNQYKITSCNDGIYTGTVSYKESQWCGEKPVLRTHFVTFTVNNG